MTFTVAYRGKDGKRVDDCFEAESRDVLFKLLAAKGINAIRVMDGDTRSRQARSSCVAVPPRLSRCSVAAIAGSVMVAGGAWWLLGHREATVPQTETPDEPKVVQPRQQQKQSSSESNPEKQIEIAAPKPLSPDARPTKVGEVVNGYVKLPSGRLHRQLGVVTNSIAGRPKGKHEIFVRDCDNDIAGCLTVRPGDLIMDIPPYNGKFKRDFVESLKESIEITEDDTPEQAQLKRDVIAARAELKDAMDRGEDIEQIMLETRKELQRLMRIRMDYNNLFRENLKKCETDADVQDLFNACNMVLEENGIAPLKYGPITKRNVLRARQSEVAREHQTQD